MALNPQRQSDLPSPVMPAAAHTPSPAAMRRVLRRARDGVVLNVDEAALALTARGDDLVQLCASAARVRDAGLESAGRRGPNGGLPISYSRKVFIPVTHLCRDTCHYCTFVTVPGRLRAEGRGMYLEPDEILDIARRGAELGCKEALFTLGDRPETRWPEARQWLDERGYDSTLDYVRAMAIRVLEETGLLPHLNPGVMSWSELSRLKPVAPSMGMMLETTSTRLFETRGQAHYGSPDKDPQVRLRTLTDAGRLSVPFTTGLLVGIGETLTERAETIHAIRKSHKEFGHIQEVIVQNFRAKDHTAMAAVPDAGIDDFLATIAVTRLVLGPAMRVQAPPNLVSRAECLALIGAGVDDWGGVSPLTPDHVNPERPWPALDDLAVGDGDQGAVDAEVRGDQAGGAAQHGVIVGVGVGVARGLPGEGAIAPVLGGADAAIEGARAGPSAAADPVVGKRGLVLVEADDGALVAEGVLPGEEAAVDGIGHGVDVVTRAAAGHRGERHRGAARAAGAMAHHAG